MDYPSKSLDYFEDLVFKNWELFLKKFLPEAFDLVRVRFASCGVEFVAVLSEGQHVVDGVSIDKFLRWCEEVK